MNAEHVKVIFREFEGEVIAFFPEARVNYGNILSYQHVGQHCEASLEFFWGTNVADGLEYTSLLKELEQIYADCILDVRKRLNYDDLLQKAWKR